VAAALLDAGRSSGMPYLDDADIPAPEGIGHTNLHVRDGTRYSPSRADRPCGFSTRASPGDVATIR
jgi:hypothetical protein